VYRTALPVVLSASLSGCVGQDLSYPFTLTKSGDGRGSVTSTQGIDCGPECSVASVSVLAGTQIDLTATPESDSRFGGWSGPGCDVTSEAMTIGRSSGDPARSTCDARFDPLQTFTLTVTRSGTGTGVVRGISTGEIDCGTTCFASFAPGSRITLEAEATGLSFFNGWNRPECQSASLAITVTMDADKTCDARFDTPTSSQLAFLAAYRYERRTEGMALIGNNRAVIGAYEMAGKLRQIDYSNPANPVAGTEVDCASNIRGVAYVPPGRGLRSPFVRGTSVDAGGCQTGTPLGGAVEVFRGGAFGQYRWIPNTSFAAQASFFGTIDIENLETGIPRTVTLATGRNCVFSLATNDSVIVGVGREGTAGTATENCNNERKAWFASVARASVDWSVDLGGAPRDAALSPDGRWAFVANYGLGVVHRIDIPGRMVAGTFAVPGAVGVDVDPTGRYLAATSFDASRLLVFDLTSNTEIANEDSRGGGAVQVRWDVQGSATERLLLVQNFQDAGRPGGSLVFFRFRY
jgi:hypothetical protein